MNPAPDDIPLPEAIADVASRIQALAAHAGLSYGDRRAILGTLGPYSYLQRKHTADGRMLATPTGDREETCRGN